MKYKYIINPHPHIFHDTKSLPTHIFFKVTNSGTYFIMPDGGVVALRHQFIDHWSGFLQFDSQFDPIELWGTHIPFVDPFSYDERTFRTDTPAPPPSMNGASFSSLCLGLLLLTSQASPAHPRFQDLDDPYLFQDPYRHQDPLLP